MADEFLASIDASPNTSATYNGALHVFADFLSGTEEAAETGTVPLTRMRVDSLANFRRWMRQERGYSRRTETTYLAGTIRFIEWLDAKSMLPGDLTSSRIKLILSESRGRRRIGYKTQPIKEAVPLVLDYYDNLAVPSHEKPRGRRQGLSILRNRAIVHTLFATGLRAQELTSLNRGDCADGNNDQVLITGKGEKERLIILNAEAQKAISLYCEERDVDKLRRNPNANLQSKGEQEARRREPLFVRHDLDRLTRITTKTVWQIVNDAAHAIGLSQSISPHDFRRYIATSMLSEGMPLESVQAFLGHESIVTTRTVYAHTWNEVLDDQVKTYRPSKEQALHRASKKSTQ